MKNLLAFDEFINESQIPESRKNTHKIILTFTDSRLLNRFKTTPTFSKMVSPDQMKSLIVGDNHLTINNVALNGLERMSSIGLYSMNKLNEATTNWSILMKAVRRGKAPYSMIVIDPLQNYPNGKVIKQEINIKIPQIIPAKFEGLRKEFPNATIHLEDGEGTRLWTNKR